MKHLLVVMAFNHDGFSNEAVPEKTDRSISVVRIAELVLLSISIAFHIYHLLSKGWV